MCVCARACVCMRVRVCVRVRVRVWRSSYSYCLRGGRPKARISSPDRVKDCLHCGVHPARYPLGAGSSFFGVRWLKIEADHPTLISAQTKKALIYTPTPLCVFMAQCLIIYAYIHISIWWS
jgi:hypothetical protein